MSSAVRLKTLAISPIVALSMKKVTQQALTRRTEAKQFEVAVAAIYLLGGAERSIDTEDAAVKCHELAPKLFSWQKYKDQINLELVRVGLSDAKKPKNGALLSGSGREGWRLTARGLDWISNEGSGVVKAVRAGINSHSKAGSVDAVRRQRELERLLQSEAWSEWSDSGKVSLRTARAFFRSDENTSNKMLQIKVARLRAMFEYDLKLTDFLKDAAKVVVEEGNQ
jgi:hypothetical protein